MKLIGSTTSPYVRRIRFALEHQTYDFQQVNVFSTEGQAELKRYTSTGRVPLLVDGDQVIWDSFLIVNYLQDEPLSLEVQKDLVLINEMTDAGVQLFQLRKFEIDPDDQGVFSQNHLKRIQNILEYFSSYHETEWTVTSQWLLATLDWFTFRSIYPWQDEQAKLVQWLQTFQDLPIVKHTDPRC